MDYKCEDCRFEEQCSKENGNDYKLLVGTEKCIEANVQKSNAGTIDAGLVKTNSKTIKQLIKHKRVLRKQIESLIVKFEEEFEVPIISIGLERETLIQQDKTTYLQPTIKMELDL